MTVKFELYEDNIGQYRWRLRDSSDRILAVSSQGYAEKSDCYGDIKLVKQLSLKAYIADLTETPEAGTEATGTELGNTKSKGALVKLGDDLIFSEMPEESKDFPVHLL